VDLIRWPEFDQTWPKAADLVISCLARSVLRDIPPYLKLGDGIAAQIDDPGVCSLKFGSDIADDNSLTIAKIEDWCDPFLCGGPSW
jgi:hypothetical protein